MVSPPASSHLLELKRSRPHAHESIAHSRRRRLLPLDTRHSTQYSRSVFFSADKILLDSPPRSPLCIASPPGLHHSPWYADYATASIGTWKQSETTGPSRLGQSYVIGGLVKRASISRQPICGRDTAALAPDPWRACSIQPLLFGPNKVDLKPGFPCTASALRHRRHMT